MVTPGTTVSNRAPRYSSEYTHVRAHAHDHDHAHARDHAHSHAHTHVGTLVPFMENNPLLSCAAFSPAFSSALMHSLLPPPPPPSFLAKIQQQHQQLDRQQKQKQKQPMQMLMMQKIAAAFVLTVCCPLPLLHSVTLLSFRAPGMYNASHQY